MNYEEAKAAVLADHELVAIETGVVAHDAPYRLDHETDFAGIERKGYAQPDRSYDLFRPVHQYTVADVDGKEYQYHEAAEIKKQLGDAVRAVFSRYPALPPPEGLEGGTGESFYLFHRTEVMQFEGVARPSIGRSLHIELPDRADPSASWDVVATKREQGK